jgi:hypothetical protein
MVSRTYAVVHVQPPLYKAARTRHCKGSVLLGLHRWHEKLLSALMKRTRIWRPIGSKFGKRAPEPASRGTEMRQHFGRTARPLRRRGNATMGSQRELSPRPRPGAATAWAGEAWRGRTTPFSKKLRLVNPVGPSNRCLLNRRNCPFLSMVGADGPCIGAEVPPAITAARRGMATGRALSSAPPAAPAFSLTRRSLVDQPPMTWAIVCHSFRNRIARLSPTMTVAGIWESEN